MDKKEYTNTLDVATASTSCNHEFDDSSPDSKFNGCGISKSLLKAIKSKKWIFRIVHKTKEQEILICSITNTRSRHIRSHIYEINDFLDGIQLDNEIADKRLKYVAEELIYRSLRLSYATVFKFLWSKLSHLIIGESCSDLLELYHGFCNFKNFEYIQCLYLILRSPNAINLKKSSLGTGIEVSPLCYMLQEFRYRNINPRERIFMIVYGLRVAEAKLSEITYAYELYGFNDEVIILVRYSNFHSALFRYTDIFRFILKFILALDIDPCLSLDRIDDLGLVPKRAYLKLMNLLPNGVFRQEKYASIRTKREMLNKFPTLYEISKYHLQKHIQLYYKIAERSEFCKVVENLPLPRVIKDSLCIHPPLYCLL